ncbi:unnamed protein product [Caenorhabditis auriculariae]|uniref:Uncharacterized protein n=1 Tax=Caenorhabditis auriculariae TaxID=2777116 RepID=A0A8S1GTY3_9PELO|nr:unnamed protein product [Caenorhabditis auriculariae]
MYNWSTGLCETVRNSPVDDVCWRCRGVAILLMRIGSTAAMKILKEARNQPTEVLSRHMNQNQRKITAGRAIQ